MVKKILDIMKRNTIIVSLLLLTFGWCGSLWAQCPDIYYAESSNDPRMVERGWDTLVNCHNRTIKLSATTFVPPLTYQGYHVYSIPYAPPDPTFCSHAGGGGKLNVTDDDLYDANPMQMPFPFVFFGNTYTQAVVGPNGNISFDTSVCNESMPYNVSTYAPIPSASTLNTKHIKNNILGLWEDIDPRYCDSTGFANSGIHKAIFTMPPQHNGPECRMLLVSYNAIPKFGNNRYYSCSQNYSTSQIACYESTNIIEVHIKRHWAACGTDHNQCVVGIIDSLGFNAYTPSNRNPLINQNILTPEAWRFAPYGATDDTIRWYLGPTVDPAMEITSTNPNDSIYLCEQTGVSYRSIMVSPRVTTQYTMRLTCHSANGTFYDIAYTITVGCDFAALLHVIGDTLLCLEEAGTYTSIFPAEDTIPHTGLSWYCDNPNLQVNGSTDGTVVTVSANQLDLFTGIYRDSLERVSNLTIRAEFANGCLDSVVLPIHNINNIDRSVTDSFCIGVTYAYGEQQLHQPGTYTRAAVTPEGCPYNETLYLLAREVPHTVEYRVDCMPYTWIDGVTYEQTTDAPSITYTTEEGCDSIYSLSYTRDTSLKAYIGASPPYATLGNRDIMLSNQSHGYQRILWKLPDGTTSNQERLHYTVKKEEDSVDVFLVAYAYDCVDTARYRIYQYKEAIWFPNAFTPDEISNKVFQAQGLGILSLKVEIYNRNGLLIYQFEGFDGSWDGTVDGHKMPQGSYVYKATYTNIIDPSNPLTQSGTVQLLR